MSVQLRPSTHVPHYLNAQISCYPVVKKFLAHHYGPGPFVVGSQQSNPYASFLAACLDRNARPNKEIPVARQMTETLTLGIAQWRPVSGFGRELSPWTVREFNRFVKQSFMDRIVTELVIRQVHGKSVTQSITRILKRYNLSEEELSFDSVLRYYTRKREGYLAGIQD